MTPLTEAQYRLIEASGHVAQASRQLLAWLHQQEQGYECRCCGQREAHDPTMPCGQLRAALERLGPAVKAVTIDRTAITDRDSGRSE